MDVFKIRLTGTQDEIIEEAKRFATQLVTEKKTGWALFNIDDGRGNASMFVHPDLKYVELNAMTAVNERKVHGIYH